MGNCLVTKLKSSVQNDNLPYFDKAVLFFDSTIGNTEAVRGTQTNIYLNGVTLIENLDESLFELNDSGWLQMKYDVTAPSGYTRKMFFNINQINNIQTCYGADAANIFCKYKFRIMDLARCTNLVFLSVINTTFLDTNNPNIEDLATLTKCKYYNFRGEITDMETLGTWKGDLVKFADGLLDNGLDVTQVPVISMVTQGGSAGHMNCQFTINGEKLYTGYNYNTWIEFSSGGHYNIYKNVRQSDPDAERTSGELAYSK